VSSRPTALQSAGERPADGNVLPVAVLGDACAKMHAVTINAAEMLATAHQVLMVFMAP
jgi:hypothetical protein